MTIVEQIAAFAANTSFDDLSDEMRTQLKTLMVDTIGCAIGSLGEGPVRYLREQADDFGGAPHCTLIGGGKSAPDAAAFYNTSLIRYLDFNDGFMGKLATSHPSDNTGAVLAAAEYADASGADFMTALALAYEVQCRLCDSAPYEKRGFDQPMAGAYAVAAGASRALGLDAEKTANAIAISGVRQNPLLITRTGELSHWKGFAYAAGCHTGVHSTFLAMRGVTGQLGLIEGPLGVFESVTGEFEIDWSDTSLTKMLEISVKRYNAGLHSQTAIEGVIDMKREHGFSPEDIEEVEIGIYERAYFIMGEGKAGAREHVLNKETADHSLPYVLSAAIIDEQVLPAQYEEARIRADDVQTLLKKVRTTNSDEMTARYPAQSPVLITITLKDGSVHKLDKPTWEGHFSTPMSWATVNEKFEALSEAHADASLRGEIVDAVSRLDSIRIKELTALLERVNTPK